MNLKRRKDENWEKRRPHYPWRSDVDYRARPEAYKVGKGEQGVLLCEPYKSEILPHWRFKTPEDAAKSSVLIFRLFKTYLSQDEFVGADMARKYLQMGYTRARRYANHKGGRKYDGEGLELRRSLEDPAKAESARIFYAKWKEAEDDPLYRKLKAEWKEKIG